MNFRFLLFPLLPVCLLSCKPNKPEIELNIDYKGAASMLLWFENAIPVDSVTRSPGNQVMAENVKTESEADSLLTFHEGLNKFKEGNRK